MKKLFCVLLVLSMAIPTFADKIDFGVSGRAPTIKGDQSNTTVIIEEANSQINTAFGELIKDLNKQFSDMAFDSPTKFLGAMANSSVYGSHGATTRAYGGYKKFSATIGPMFGFQLPSGLGSIMDDLNGISDSLKKDGDINLGVGPNVINVNFGLNMGIIKLDKLYLGARVGYFKLPSLIDNFNYDYLTLGLTANYQIIPSLSLAGLITWRGLSLGSGLLYNKSNIKITVPLGEKINEEIGSGADSLGYVRLDPKASLNLNINTVTIPLEAITAIKLLIFNIPLGLGADIAFGKTSLGFGVDSDIELDLDPSKGLQQASKGNISVGAGASAPPAFFNFKIMTGLGFAFGPVIIDIPITFYPASNGYTFGLTMGAVF
jgi:hypothetical protein